MTKKNDFTPGRGYTREEWEDESDEAPEITPQMWAERRTFAQAHPDLAATMKPRMGRPPKEHPKVSVHIRLDADVVDHFKADGAGWQSRMNAALRKTSIG